MKIKNILIQVFVGYVLVLSTATCFGIMAFPALLYKASGNSSYMFGLFLSVPVGIALLAISIEWLTGKSE